MRAFRKLTAMAMLLGITAGVAAAQTRTVSQINQQNVRQMLIRIQDRIDLLRNNFNMAGNRDQVYNNRDENATVLLNNFEDAVRQMRQQVNRRYSTASDAQLVLDRASALDSFMSQRRFD